MGRRWWRQKVGTALGGSEWQGTHHAALWEKGGGRLAQTLMKWTAEKLSELRKMVNEEHLETVEIAQRFGLDPRNVSNRISLHDLMSRDEFFRRQKEKNKKAQQSFANKSRPFVENMEAAMSWPDMGYCLGALMGDGAICLPKNHGGICWISVKDKAFADEFARALRAVTGEEPKRHEIYRDHTAYIADRTVTSKGIYYWVGSCKAAIARKFKELLSADFILCQDDFFVAAFLRGAFDSDGCVAFRERDNLRRSAVEICVLPAGEASLLASCMARLGIGYSMYMTKPLCGYKPMHRFVIRAHREILRFADLVGFTTSHRRDRLALVVKALSKGGAPS
jgi:hypothetical protein